MILPFQEFLDSLLVRHAGGRRRRGARAPGVLGRRGLVWRRRDAAIVARRGSRVCHLNLLLAIHCGGHIIHRGNMASPQLLPGKSRWLSVCERPAQQHMNT